MILRYSTLLLLLPLLRAQDSGGGTEDDDTAHFSDVGKGRISWIVEDQSTPWIGSYYFLGSSISHSTVLLSVVDSSTGKKLGECATSGVTEQKRSAEEPDWKKFVWTLYQNSLECNITGSDPYVVELERSEHPRSFSVRILAIKGPRCFRDLIVQNEQPNGCPPILKRNTFSAHNFDCGCPKSIIERWTAPGSTEVPKPVSSGISNENGRFVDENGVAFPLFSLGENETQENFGNQGPSSSTFKFTAHACVGYECKNNGTCVLDIHSQPNCFCSEGFAGERCEMDLCAQMDCKNGGFCQIQNGTPVCRCPAGTLGARCETVLCPNDCLNGGVCEFMNEIPACHCSDGFIGPNCNVKDNCRENSTCSVFGEGAACTTDPTSFAMISDVLVDSNYSCQCVNEEGHWTDCLSLALSRQASSTQRPKTASPAPEKESSPVVVPPMAPSPSGTVETENSQTENTTVFVPPPATPEEGEKEEEEENSQEQATFPLTSPEPEEEPEEAESMTSSTPEIPQGAGDEDELEGDNGFETVTQENIDKETTTKHQSLWTMPPVDENENTVSEEEEERKIEPTESSETTEDPDAGESEPGETARNSGRASWLSWAVAIIAIIVLIFLIGATSLFIVRYVRRSRRLHGKYNPAREENAVASTYAMPMTTVSKQERLI
ncbi:hypothetical protein FO519_006288 [Halicephalobus sp. NKZ332]|nr:hypothetical protein FO519_006288 [Halicephalobus sp. NKZ332]